MQDQPIKSPISIAARIFWFCIFPHVVVICSLGLAGLLVYVNLKQQTSTPDDGFKGIILIFFAPYALVICAFVAAVVSITSFALSFIRWRSRIFASVMGLAFLIFANVAGLSAIALLIYSQTK